MTIHIGRRMAREQPSRSDADAESVARLPGGRSPTTRRFGLIAGLGVFVVLRLMPEPAAMPAEAWAVAALAGLMALWWMTEAIPVPATGLLPLLALPLLGARDPVAAAAPYANPLVFLFLGGFLIALGLERWGLHRRLALALLGRIGPRPDALVAGFLVAPAALSMWLSNTATSILMLPIGISVAALVQRGAAGEASAREDHELDAALLLAIAYGASLGGIATLIGTPPNALLAGFLQETTGQTLGFARWMAFAVPLSIVMLAATWLVLTRLAFRVPRKPLAGARRIIGEEAAALGPLTGPEKRVAGVFAAVALLWLLRPALSGALPSGLALTDPMIAVAGALALFVLPAGTAPGERLLDWSQTRRLPWGVLVLFGGGLSLAAAIAESGLAAWIAGALSGLADWPLGGVMMGVVGVVIVLTELTSNTATAAAFLPLVAELASTLGRDPLVLAVPAAIAASCAFMLPVATPPNAIVYGSGRVSIAQMVRAGVWLNLLAVLLITGLAFALMPVVFGVALGG
jgi:sodium-dependent dicarboxylate transporter 2/3/5